MKSKEEIIEEANQIQGWIQPGELNAIYDLSNKYIKEGGKAFEVGSWKGKSSVIIANVCKNKNAKLYCIDTFTGSELHEEHYKEAEIAGPYIFSQVNIKKNLKGLPVEYIIENSLTAHTKLQKESYDLGFIDGNHCFPVINQDLDNYWPKIKKEGILLCHDYAQVCPDVMKAIDLKFGNIQPKLIYNTIFTIIK